MSEYTTLRLFTPIGYILLSILNLRIFDFDPGAKRTECWSAEEWAVVGVSSFGVLIGVAAEIYALVRFRGSLRCGYKCRDDGQEPQTSAFSYIIMTILAVIVALSHAFTYLVNTAPDPSVNCDNAVVPIGPVIGSIAMTVLFALLTFAIVSGGSAYQRLDRTFGSMEMSVTNQHNHNAGPRDGPTVHAGHTDEEDAELGMHVET